MCPLLLIVEHERSDGRLDRFAIPGWRVRPHRHGYLFVIQQLTEVRTCCQDPGMAIYQIVLMGYIQRTSSYSPPPTVPLW